ncbi:MAG: colanic acid biosynthesis glycosyltransferase WcaL, partial [Gammaproteobacteria bacterium]|nr:colanic acid biosynthesis glycosyltransferase WcaL [Gammaproteobacteria bacterium]
MAREIAVLLKGYPRLSETFIANEIHGLEERGLRLRIYSLRKPTDASVHPVHRQIRAPVVYLPEYLYRSPLRVLAGLRACIRRPGFGAALRIWLRDLRRDPTPNRIRRFGQALVLAREMPPEIDHIHAHFLHTPASVARYAAIIGERSWSCSAHAKDIWTTPDWEKREKLSDCAWVVTCTEANRSHLCELAASNGQVELLYHGLDERRFPVPNGDASTRNGSTPDLAARLLCVGRAVEKKGLDDLLSALARLPPDLYWEFHHVGAGPLLGRLGRMSR